MSMMDYIRIFYFTRIISCTLKEWYAAKVILLVYYSESLLLLNIDIQKLLQELPSI